MLKYFLILTVVESTAETCELCSWSRWNEWSQCSVTCLHADQLTKRSRNRFCTLDFLPSMHLAPVIESADCNQLNTVQFDLELCPVPPWLVLVFIKICQFNAWVNIKKVQRGWNGVNGRPVQSHAVMVVGHERGAVQPSCVVGHMGRQ